MDVRKRRFLVAATFLALTASRASPQGADPGFEPVPAANISEGTLSVPDENFSIRAPGPLWDWLRDKPAKDAVGRTYLCRNLRTGERFLLVVGKSSGGSGAKYAEDWLARIKASQEAQGRELVGTRTDPSDIPAPGSRRVSTMITAPGTTIYFTGYVLGTDRVYALQHYSDVARESPVFNAFARSFALTHPAAPARTPSWLGGAGALIAYASILVACIGLGGLVNAIARRPVVSGGYVALVLILIVMGLKIAGEAAGGLTPETVGSVVGEALIPALIAVWAHGRYGKGRPATTRR